LYAESFFDGGLWEGYGGVEEDEEVEEVYAVCGGCAGFGY